MHIETITPPAIEPVSLEEAFTHLRIDPGFTSDDTADADAVETMITAAREDAEHYTKRAFVQQTVLMTMNDTAAPWAAVELPRPPLIEVQSVEYYDADNTLQTVDPALYYTVAGFVPKLVFTSDFTKPAVYARDDAIRVNYLAGYAPLVSGTSESEAIDYTANVPRVVKAAILIGVQLQFDELSPEKRAALERARDALLEPLRIHTLA